MRIIKDSELRGLLTWLMSYSNDIICLFYETVYILQNVEQEKEYAIFLSSFCINDKCEKTLFYKMINYKESLFWKLKGYFNINPNLENIINSLFYDTNDWIKMSLYETMSYLSFDKQEELACEICFHGEEINIEMVIEITNNINKTDNILANY